MPIASKQVEQLEIEFLEKVPRGLWVSGDYKMFVIIVLVVVTITKIPEEGRRPAAFLFPDPSTRFISNLNIHFHQRKNSAAVEEAAPYPRPEEGLVACP